MRWLMPSHLVFTRREASDIVKTHQEMTRSHACKTHGGVVALGKRLMRMHFLGKENRATPFGKNRLVLIGHHKAHTALADEFFSKINDADRQELILGYLSYGAKSKDSGNENLEITGNKEETL